MPVRIELPGLHSDSRSTRARNRSNAGSRPPHDVNALSQVWKRLFHPGCTIFDRCISWWRQMKSPRMLQRTSPFSTSKTVSSVFFVLLRVSPSGHFATGRSRKMKEFEGSPVRTWTRQILPVLASSDVNFGGLTGSHVSAVCDEQVAGKHSSSNRCRQRLVFLRRRVRG